MVGKIILSLTKYELLGVGLSMDWLLVLKSLSNSAKWYLLDPRHPTINLSAS